MTDHFRWFKFGTSVTLAVGVGSHLFLVFLCGEEVLVSVAGRAVVLRSSGKAWGGDTGHLGTTGQPSSLQHNQSIVSSDVTVIERG